MPQRAEPADCPRGSRFCVPFNNHEQRDAIRDIMQVIEDGLAVSPWWYYDASERRFVRMERGAHFSRFEIKVANENKPYPNAKGPALKHVLIFTLLGSKGEVGNDEVDKTREYLDQLLAASEALNGVYRGGVRQIRVLPYNASVDDYFLCYTKPLDMGKDWVQRGYAPALAWKGLELFQASYVSLRNVETPEWAAAAREMAPAELRSVGNAIPRYATTMQVRKEGWCIGERGPYPKPEAIAKRTALLADEAETKAQAFVDEKFAPKPWLPTPRKPSAWAPLNTDLLKAEMKAKKLAELKAMPRPLQPPERPSAADERKAQLNATKRAAKAERVERKMQKEYEVKRANKDEQFARKRHSRQLLCVKKAEGKAEAAERKAKQRNEAAAAPGARAEAKKATKEATREADAAVKEAKRARSKAKRFKKEATACLERLQMLKSLSAVAVQALVAKELAAKEAEAAAHQAA